MLAAKEPPIMVDFVKRAAGRAAADLVANGQTIGLGTGSTVFFALERLAERIRSEGLVLRGVPTSTDTEKKARDFGIPLSTLEEVEALDLTIDGADEIDDRYHMVKGGGGALLREKVVASITRREVIVVGRDKLVERLGKAFPLPIEIVPFARSVVERRIPHYGAHPVLRTRGGAPYVTDNGNWILDCLFAHGIPDPAAMEIALARMPGIVEVGLFIDLAHVLVIGDADGSVEIRERP
jgi:ribose 5-phosphate isomerase A